MRQQNPGQAEPQAELVNDICDVLLEETQKVTRQTLRRLQKLRDRYPTAFSPEHLSYLQELSSPSPPGDGQDREAERRKSPRFSEMGKRVTIAEVGAKNEVHDGLLLDKSWQGLLLLSPRPQKVGGVLAIHFADTAEGSSVFWVEVKHCRPWRGGWAVGCQRLEPL
jgi:hypothetical protein